MNKERRAAEDRRVAAALQAQGISVRSVFDLVNTKETYPEAVPVLLDLLERGIADDWILEGVVRALSVKEARGVAFKPLQRLFTSSETAPGVRWAVGNALAAISRSSDREALIELARDRRYGKARQEIVARLGKWKDTAVTALLIELLEDDEVVLHALEALERNPDPAMAPALGRLADHPNDSVRRAASSLLRRLKALDN